MNTPHPPQPAQIPAVRKWSDFRQTPGLFVARRKLLTPNARVFTMGSCFAAELRKSLQRSGLTVYPDYLSVQFDRESEVFNHLPERDSIEHYDTFVIKQEFEVALGEWTDRDAGIWPVSGCRVNAELGSPVAFQEPSRKMIYGRSHEGVARLSKRIDDAIRAGIEQADVLVLTLGLTEVWQHRITKRYLCRAPMSGWGGRQDLAIFKLSSFVENYQNLKDTLDLLLRFFPNKQVVLSVSPVPLEATFAPTDVATANVESKAILRAVAGQICREYPANVTYFPAYEMATVLPGPVFKEDGRHVLPEFADKVTSAFMGIFS